MSFVAIAVGAAATAGAAIIGNQAKQKAKGAAGQAERDAQTAQDAADAKLKQQHTEDVQAQSTAAGVARAAVAAPLTRSAALISPDEQPGIAPVVAKPRTLMAPPLRAAGRPVPVKTLLGS